MFAPLPGEAAKGYRTFTGEPINSEAGARHVLGEEACRALLLLDVPATRPALARATANFMERLDDAERRQYSVGTYCCGICSGAYWRQLTAGGLDRKEERLATGMKVLKLRRLENGRWRAFPFWYTLLTLTEIDVPGAKAEKQFAAPLCERHLRRSPTGDYAARPSPCGRTDLGADMRAAVYLARRPLADVVSAAMKPCAVILFCLLAIGTVSGQETNPKSITGQCHCGQVKYEVQGPVVESNYCDCRGCQRATGTLKSPFLVVRQAGFKVVAGEPATFRAASGVKCDLHGVWHFCPKSAVLEAQQRQ